jgi:two-component system sensor histidine kinase/response regulator
MPIPCGMDDNLRQLWPCPEELLDDRYLLDTLMEQTSDQIYFKDNQSRFVRISRGLADRLGLAEPSEAIGKTDFDFFSGEHAHEAFADEQRLLQTGEALIGIEERETWVDGRVAWVSTTNCARL